MKNIIAILFFTIVFNQTVNAEGNFFPQNTVYEVCFTPSQNCTQIIVNQISKAKKSIYVQAYSFTSVPIAKAMVDAKNRGLEVKVILDKSQVGKNRYSSAQFLVNHNIPVWIDYKPAIAHNKIMIFDENIVETGSFNFTKAAQFKNAENILIISDPGLAKQYAENWHQRQIQSVPYDQYNRYH